MTTVTIIHTLKESFLFLPVPVSGVSLGAGVAGVADIMGTTGGADVGDVAGADQL